MTSFLAHEETTHEAILDTSVVDDTVLTNKVSCICIMLNMTNRHFMVFVVETWLIWCTTGSYRIIKVIRGTEELALMACLIGKLFIPCECVDLKFPEVVFRHLGQKPINDKSTL